LIDDAANVCHLESREDPYFFYVLCHAKDPLNSVVFTQYPL
jgi:hypothetical protein